MDNTIVSVICNTYNHEKYIKDALDGFVMQKTCFPFEVLIHDDASTDNTANIIREYEKKYPDIIKPIYQTENQYSKGAGLVGKIQYARAKGKYIALCEGDDYWTDPYKLQKQYDALEKHPEINICATAAYAVEANTKKFLYEISPKNYNTLIKIEDVIIGGGGYVSTASLMYRSSINNNIPQFRTYINLDYTLQIHASIPNGMLYINDKTSVYRVLSDNSWTERQKKSIVNQIHIIDKTIIMLKIFNKNTDNLYENSVSTAILNKEFAKLIIINDYKLMKTEKYRNLYNKLSIKKKLKIKLKYFFPQLIKIKKLIKKQ